MSWCPAWEPKREELMTDVVARTELMRNAAYDKLGLAAERLSFMHQQCAKVQSDTFGVIISPAESKCISDTASLATKTVCVTFALFALCVALTKLAGKRPQMDTANAFQKQFALKGVNLPASMQKALDGFIAGKGAADDTPM